MKIENNIELMPKVQTPGATGEIAAHIEAMKKTIETEMPLKTAEDLQDAVDTLVVSEEAKRGAVDWEARLEELREEMRALLEGIRQAGEAGDGAAEAWKEKIRCLQIAMRIMSGNNVPKEDHRFLQEKDPELYSKSITMRAEKVDPKDHDRLSEDEEDDGIAGDPENTGAEASVTNDSSTDIEAATENISE